MPSISELERQTKVELQLAAGVAIHVSNAAGPVNGKVLVKTTGFKKLLAEVKAAKGSMRLATFYTRYAQCIGAQVGATVRITFLGKDYDPRQSLANFMPAAG